MSTSKQSSSKRKQSKQSKEPSRIEVSLSIQLGKVLTFSTRYILQFPIKKYFRLLALILIICQLLDRPAVVVPEDGFIVNRCTTPHMAINLKRQFDKMLVSRLCPSLERIRHI